jgi:hypothetical protein
MNAWSMVMTVVGSDLAGPVLLCDAMVQMRRTGYR